MVVRWELTAADGLLSGPLAAHAAPLPVAGQVVAGLAAVGG